MDIIPADQPGEFNQALMELGEVVCIPNGMPLCDTCPVSSECLARAEGRQMELPVKPEKKARRIEKRTVFIFEQNGQTAISRRPDTGLLAGLWEFPSLNGHFTLPQVKKLMEEKGVTEAGAERLKSGKHIFSHVEWHMRGYHIFIQGQELPQDMVPSPVLAKKEELKDSYAIPVAFHSFLNQL